MERVSRRGAEFRTRCLPLQKAAAFARCLRGNSRCQSVELEESCRAQGEARWIVTWQPTNPESLAGIEQRAGGARQQRAEGEGRDYVFALDKDGGRPFWWCQSTSGEVYEVTPLTCDCADARFRPVPGGCKHQRALRLAVQEGRAERVFEPVPAAEQRRERTRQQLAHLSRLMGPA